MFFRTCKTRVEKYELENTIEAQNIPKVTETHADESTIGITK